MKQIFNPIALFFVSLTVITVIFYAVTAVYYPKVFVIATYEDLYGEWAQTYGFLVSFIFASLNGLNKQHPHRWFFVLLAVASFYVFMEEISWGQRLIGFETPKFFHDNSYQDEANLHNLVTGPVDAWTKTALTYFVAFGLIAYGVLFPVSLRYNFKPALYLIRWKIAAPPRLALILAFICAAVLELELFDFNEAEVAELLVAWCLAFTAFDSWLQNRSNKPNLSPLPYITLLLFATIVVWGTTTVLLHSPTQRAEIDERLTNGYEKFADRYQGYDYQFGILEVLKEYDKLDPNNTVMLRRIADSYEELGDMEQARVFIKKAVDEGLLRVKKEPDNVPANVSLAKSYRKLKDYGNMTIYANKAYALAFAQQQKEPDNAYLAYWLAKACEQTNRRQEAFKYYRLAHKLEPNSSRYEDAYYQMKEIMLDYEE